MAPLVASFLGCFSAEPSEVTPTAAVAAEPTACARACMDLSLPYAFLTLPRSHGAAPEPLSAGGCRCASAYNSTGVYGAAAATDGGCTTPMAAAYSWSSCDLNGATWAIVDRRKKGYYSAEVKLGRWKVGATVSLDFIWLLADALNAMMAIPNLIALLILSPAIFAMTRNYWAKDK